MTFRSFSLGLAGAALLVLLPSPSQAKEQHQLSLRNDVGRVITCGVRKKGSSAIDSFTLRAGQSWSETYSGSKTRLVLCEGALSVWQPMLPDQTYRLVQAEENRIVAEPVSR